jgi:hypothetical protein
MASGDRHTTSKDAWRIEMQCFKTMHQVGHRILEARVRTGEIMHGVCVCVCVFCLFPACMCVCMCVCVFSVCACVCVCVVCLCMHPCMHTCI